MDGDKVQLNFLQTPTFQALTPDAAPPFLESNAFVSIYRSEHEREELAVTDTQVVLQQGDDLTDLAQAFARQFATPVNRVNGQPLVATLQGQLIQWVSAEDGYVQMGLPLKQFVAAFVFDAHQRQHYLDSCEFEGSYEVPLEGGVVETVEFQARGFFASLAYRETFKVPRIGAHSEGLQIYANGVLVPAPLVPYGDLKKRVHGKSLGLQILWQVQLKTRRIGTIIQPNKVFFLSFCLWIQPLRTHFCWLFFCFCRKISRLKC